MNPTQLWPRAAYWTIKLLGLTAMLAAIAGLLYAGWLIINLVWAAIAAFVSSLLAADWSLIRRGFYSACLMVIFLYGARYIRAKALLAEHRNRKERQA